VENFQIRKKAAENWKFFNDSVRQLLIFCNFCSADLLLILDTYIDGSVLQDKAPYVAKARVNKVLLAEANEFKKVETKSYQFFLFLDDFTMLS
jgi:hypothetical protein